MGYLPPAFRTLQMRAKNLHKQYNNKNVDRLNMIRLTETIAQSLPELPESQSALAGLYIFNLDKIASSYTLSPSAMKSCSFWQRGSTLNDSLSHDLDITSQNKLDNSTRLIHIAQLLNFVRDQDSQTIYPGYPSKAAFQSELKAKLSKLIATSDLHIKELFRHRPSAAAFRLNFARMPADYNIVKKTSDGSREDFLLFLQALDAQCLAQNLDNVAATKQTSGEIIPEQTMGYLIRYSAIVYIMAQIESELKYRALSPERSELYKICQKTINVEKTTDIPHIERLNYFWILGGFIPKIDPLSNEPCSWETEAFPQARYFFLDMQRGLLDKLKNAYDDVADADPYPTVHKIRKGVNCAASVAVNMAIGTAAGNLIDIPASSRFVTNACSAIGRSRYGFPGAIMGKQIGGSIERGMATAIVGKSLQTASSTVMNAPGQMVYYPLSGIAKVADTLVNLIYGKKPANPYETPEYVNALLSLPDDVFSADKKQRLSECDMVRAYQTTLVADPEVALSPRLTR